MEPEEANTTPAPEAESQKVDLEALAQIVIDILRRELLLESDRTGR